MQIYICVHAYYPHTRVCVYTNANPCVSLFMHIHQHILKSMQKHHKYRQMRLRTCTLFASISSNYSFCTFTLCWALILYHKKPPAKNELGSKRLLSCTWMLHTSTKTTVQMLITAPCNLCNLHIMPSVSKSYIISKKLSGRIRMLRKRSLSRI